MSGPKNHHFIPRLTLRQFSEDRKHLWVYDHRESRLGNIDKVFVSRHLYTRQEVDVGSRSSRSEDPKRFEQSIRKDYVYEESIGKIESAAAPVLEKVIGRARCRKCPQLSLSETEALKEFIFLTARRTPESQARASAKSDGLYYAVARALADDQGFPMPSEEEMMKSGVHRRLEQVVLSNADARFAAGDMGHIQEAYRAFFHDTSLCIVLSERRRRFIIGSHGFAIVTVCEGQRYNRFSVFPIAPDVAILPMRDNDYKETLALVSDSHVRQTNIALAEQSHIIAGPTQSDVERYGQYIRR